MTRQKIIFLQFLQFLLPCHCCLSPSHYNGLPAAAFRIFIWPQKMSRNITNNSESVKLSVFLYFLQYLLPFHCNLLPSCYNMLPAAAFFLFYPTSKNIQEHPKQLRTREIICISTLFAIFVAFPLPPLAMPL